MGGLNKKGGWGGFPKKIRGGGVLRPSEVPVNSEKKRRGLDKKLFLFENELKSPAQSPARGGFCEEVGWGLTKAMRKIKIAFEEARRQKQF